MFAKCYSPYLMLSIGLFVAPSAEAQSPSRRAPQPQVRYAIGGDSLSQDGVPEGKLEGPHLFRSKIIENTVRKYWVFVPAQYDAAKPAAVLVFQDGARAINPEGELRVPRVLENLIAKKQIPVTVGIFITPGQRGDDFPESIGTGNPNNRDREYDVLNDLYARMLVEEILPEVGTKYALSSDPANRAIGGASSGAICAFTVAWEKPDQFRNVISMIGSFTNIHGGHIYPDLVLEADKKPIRIFLQDGVNDNRSPRNPDRDWYLQNQKMVAAFKEKAYDMAHVFGEGGHSDDHGGAMLPQMLRWIWRDHPAVTGGAGDPVAEAAAIKPELVDPFPGFDSKAKIDPNGSYTWEARGRANFPRNTLTLEFVEGKLAGKLEIGRGDEIASTLPLSNGLIEGNKISFDIRSTVGGAERVTTYQGIFKDDEIRGWSLTEFNGQPRDLPWSAKKVARK